MTDSKETPMRRTDLTDPQPPPLGQAFAPSLHDVAAALHRDRKAHGLGKYGTLLQTFNGRSAQVDRLQETLDHLVYEIQATIEARAFDQAIVSIRHRLETCSSMGSTSKVRWAFEKALEIFDEELAPAALTARAHQLAAGLLEDDRG